MHFAFNRSISGSLWEISNSQKRSRRRRRNARRAVQDMLHKRLKLARAGVDLCLVFFFYSSNGETQGEASGGGGEEDERGRVSVDYILNNDCSFR